MTAARTRRWRAPHHLAHVVLIASVLCGLAVMHGASSAAMSAGGHGPVSLPVAMGEHAGHPAVEVAHGDLSAHPSAESVGHAIASLAPGDAGSHHSLMVGCALALTGILTFALIWLRRSGQRMLSRVNASRAGPRLADRVQWAGPRLVPRFSLCVLRT